MDFLPAHPTDIPFDGEQKEEELDDPVAPPIMALENELEEADESENYSVVPLPVMPKVARSLFKPGNLPQDIISLPKWPRLYERRESGPKGELLF